MVLTDADEIPSRESLLFLKHCEPALPVLFSGYLTYAGADNVGQSWASARAVSYQQLQQYGGGRCVRTRCTRLAAWRSPPTAP